ncbi:hypothetical protein E2C01_099106 [Portunus trituberculatus]|uniref:Uncharacterized protein n=1 Tax=Portunus trituberculatus TaxID=210409 RepID=A0A5B7K9G0_PORTR|nr:hypothetical protein [Portunus trituberculatus]
MSCCVALARRSSS